MPFPSVTQITVTAALAIAANILNNRRKNDLQPRPLGVRQSDDFPVQYALGRTRVGCLLGAPPFEHEPEDPKENAGTLEVSDGVRDLHVPLLLSDGACFGLEAIWIDDIRYNLTATATEDDGSVRYRSYPASPSITPYSSTRGDLFLVRSCFAANGMQGTIYRTLTGRTGDRYLNHISWVHLQLRQPPNAAERGIGYSNFPKIEFLINGIVIPGSDRTDDSAVQLRRWWREDILGDPAPLDMETYEAAKEYGDEEIRTELDGAYWKWEQIPPNPTVDMDNWSSTVVAPTSNLPVVWASQRFVDPTGEFGRPDVNVWGQPFPWRIRRSTGVVETIGTIRSPNYETLYRAFPLMHQSKRYAFNGVLSADMRPNDVMEEFDFATQGRIVHDGQKWYTFVGQDRDAKFDWVVDSDALLDWGVKRARSSEFDGIQMSIAQSEPDDWNEAKLPVLGGGDNRPAQLRSSIGINHPIDGGRIGATFERRVQQDDIVVFTARPKTDARPYSLLPGDVVNLTVADVTPTGAYQDTIDLPDVEDRPPTILPPPTITEEEPILVGVSYSRLMSEDLTTMAGNPTLVSRITVSGIETNPSTATLMYRFEVPAARLGWSVFPAATETTIVWKATVDAMGNRSFAINVNRGDITGQPSILELGARLGESGDPDSFITIPLTSGTSPSDINVIRTTPATNADAGVRGRLFIQVEE